jgi:hypothetical protein
LSGDWIMKDSDGNPLDAKVLEIVDAARQEAFAQGWAAAIISMTTAANRMRHAGTVDLPDTDLFGLVARIEEAGGLLMQGGPGGSNLQIQYNNNGAFGGTAGLTWIAGVPTTVATSLQLVNQINDEAADLVPRGMVSIENSATDHSAHFTGMKSRGTSGSPTVVQVGDYLGSFTSSGYNGTGYERAGYYSHVVEAVSGGHLSTKAEIRTSTSGTEWNIVDADTTTTQINGALNVSDPGNNGGQPGSTGYASVTLFGSQAGDVTTGWGIFAGYPNPGDFSIRERTINTYLTIHKTVGDVIIWLGKLMFGGTTSSFPALRRSGTTIQARLADDSAFAPIQGKLTTETAFTAGTSTGTGHLTLYDSTGTAYKVNASPA